MKANTRKTATLAAAALAAALGAFAALGMLGCSSTPEPVNTNPNEAEHFTSEQIGATPITVEKSGFSVTTEATVDAEGNEVAVPAVNFAFIVRNNNSGYVADNVPFSVTGLNEAGDTVFNGTANSMFVYPGIDTAVTGSTVLSEDAGDADPGIATLSVEPLTDTVEWLKTGLSDSQIATLFTVENATAERVGSDVVVDAAVTGDPADADKVFRIVELEGTLEGHCVAIFTDADGNIVFGSESANVLIDQEAVDSMKAAEGEDAPLASNVSIMVQNAPDYADFQLYVMPSL